MSSRIDWIGAQCVVACCEHQISTLPTYYRLSSQTLSSHNIYCEYHKSCAGIFAHETSYSFHEFHAFYCKSRYISLVKILCTFCTLFEFAAMKYFSALAIRVECTRNCLHFIKILCVMIKMKWSPPNDVFQFILIKAFTTATILSACHASEYWNSLIPIVIWAWNSRNCFILLFE